MKSIVVSSPVADHARRLTRMMPQPRNRHVPRYLRACEAFVVEWARHGNAPFVQPAEVLAALNRVLAGAERFPKALFLAARRFQRVREA